MGGDDNHHLVFARGIAFIKRHRPGERLDRKKVIGAIAMSALGYYIPVIYKGFHDTISAGQLHPVPTIIGAIGLVICHSIGGVCYGMHFPQCVAPGWFDYLGKTCKTSQAYIKTCRHLQAHDVILLGVGGWFNDGFLDVIV